MQRSCPKHGSDSFGFAFVCTHLASRTRTGFNLVPDSDEENESRPSALCDVCGVERKRTGLSIVACMRSLLRRNQRPTYSLNDVLNGVLSVIACGCLKNEPRQ